MRLYPLALKIAGRRCVVVGGGIVSERKVASLVECGADVLVVSPGLTSHLEEEAARGRIRVSCKAFQAGDLDGAMLVIAATDDPAVNVAVRDAGRAAGALVNVVDVPELCDFYVPASVTRGELQITVNTTGAFPALAKQLRKELETQYGPEYGKYLELLGRLRQELKERVPDRSQRNRAEEAFLESSALLLLRQGRDEDAVKVLEECVSRFSA